MNKLQRIAVFCGSNPGTNPQNLVVAQALGSLLAVQGIELVYGGGNMGIMGELARSAMAGGGKVTGIIPERLNNLVAHTDLTELLVVPGMHERKQRMYELADAFIILPGGIGTLEEFLEIYTWQQLGYHQKPVGILDVQEFFAPLFALLDHLVATGFFKAEHRQALVRKTDPASMLKALQTTEIRLVSKLPERA